MKWKDVLKMVIYNTLFYIELFLCLVDADDKSTNSEPGLWNG
jgi:hypothetical protein